MRTPTLSCLLVALFAIPQALYAQGIGVGGRAGTLGFGAEAALSLSDNFLIRGGLGSFIFEFEGDYEGVTYTVSPPSLMGTLGIDLYPGSGSFRFMAGIMIRDGDIELKSGDLSEGGPIEIGDNEYDEAGTLQGALATRSASPFVGLGFGHHTEGGFGFFADFGVAFVGEADVTVTAEGPIASVPADYPTSDGPGSWVRPRAAFTCWARPRARQRIAQPPAKGTVAAATHAKPTPRAANMLSAPAAATSPAR